MKRLLTVTILFCLIISLFCVFSFASNGQVVPVPVCANDSNNTAYDTGTLVGTRNMGSYDRNFKVASIYQDSYFAFYMTNSGLNMVFVGDNGRRGASVLLVYNNDASETTILGGSRNPITLNPSTNLYYVTTDFYGGNNLYNAFDTFQDAMDAIKDYIENGPSEPSYNPDNNIGWFTIPQVNYSEIGTGTKFDDYDIAGNRDTDYYISATSDDVYVCSDGMDVVCISENPNFAAYYDRKIVYENGDIVLNRYNVDQHHKTISEGYNISGQEYIGDVTFYIWSENMGSDNSMSAYIPMFSDDEFNIRACNSLYNYLYGGNPSPAPTYTKNPNVDEFIANTLISMGFRYSQYTDSLLVASEAWDYITNPDNFYIGTDGNRLDKPIVWDIDNVVSYCNAQSNNYLDWSNGYKVSYDVTKALHKFVIDNYVSSNLGQGTLSGYSVLYDSSYSADTLGGFSQPKVSANTFRESQTITYFNGKYLHSDNVIDLDQFTYTPSVVRQFIGYSDTPSIVYPNTPPSGFGTLTPVTDPNTGETTYDIDVNFPSLEWIADAIQSLMDFLSNLITTVSNFLSKIIDTLESLFSDAFESLSEFGQGFLDFINGVWSGTEQMGQGVLPSSIWDVVRPFLMLAIGIGLLKFVLKAH